MAKLKRLAEQVAGHPHLMAGLVVAYQRRHNLDDHSLMRHLGIDADGLARLVLARRPRPDHKIEDTRALADRVGCQMALLWGIVAGAVEMPKS
ncbi:MAG: hypothetical protein KatS3mg057_2508 [Herpetosiphonaceae bacterium]|nr:MAG: hypothetical protein KatS3mg057_2508 [Herpetosiphonaceae bacterium]